MAQRITALGDVRIFDKKTGKLIAEGQMNELVYQDGNGQWWKVKRDVPKRCPHCGEIIEES